MAPPRHPPPDPLLPWPYSGPAQCESAINLNLKNSVPVGLYPFNPSLIQERIQGSSPPGDGAPTYNFAKMLKKTAWNWENFGPWGGGGGGG